MNQASASVDSIQSDELRRRRLRGSRERADGMIAFMRDYAGTRLNSRLIDERRCISPNVVLDLGREGLLGLQVEQAYGGQALSHGDMFRVMEQATAMDANVALLVSVHNGIGIPPIRHFAAESVKREALPMLASGRALTTIAASEPGAGGNFRAIGTKAIRRADGTYVLNGEKRWISLGAWSEYISVFAQLEDANGQAMGITGFLVRNGTPGYSPAEEALTYGMKGIPQNRIRLRNLELAPSSLLGQEGQGSLVAQTAFMGGRLLVGVAALGAMKRCLQVASQFAQHRSIATGTLFDNGITQAILNDSIMSTHAVDGLVYYIGEQLDLDGALPEAFYFVCKIMSSELMWKVVDRCVQMLGARGFVDTNVVGQYFRDERLLRIFEGPTELIVSHLGVLVQKNESAFLTMLRDRFDANSIVRLLEEAFDTLRAHACRDADKARLARYAHVRAAHVGELACWGLIASLTHARAARSALDRSTAHWAAEALGKCARKIRSRLNPEDHHLAPAAIADIIAGYELSIGHIEQTMSGEDCGLDPLLKAPASGSTGHHSMRQDGDRAGAAA